MSSRFFPFALVTADPATGLRAVAETNTPIDQQLADAFNANNAVLAYTNGIGNTTLPALPVEPEWYKAFKLQFAQTKIHAMKWTNTIGPGLVGIPSGIADYAFTWQTNMTNIDAALSVLVTDPKNAGAQRAVVNGLTKMIDGLKVFEKIVADFGQDILDFDRDITADAAILRQASADSKHEAGYNRDQVKQLTEHVAQLKREIQTWQVVETAAGIAAGVSFFAGACIAIFTFGFGLAFGIIGAIAGITTMLVAAAKIKELSLQVRKDQDQMNDLNQQIASLDILVSTLDDLVKLSQLAGEQMKLIIAAWSTLETELKTVIKDLENAQGDVPRLDIPALQRDLQAATADWTTLREFCLKIAGIQYLQASPAKVTLPTAQAEAA